MIKRLCQSGALKPFLQLCKELVKEYEVEYSKDVHEIAYNIGKRDGARAFISDLENRIEQIANE